MAKQSSAKKEVREKEHDAKVDSQGQPLLSHLVALRKCLIRSVIALVLLFIPYFIFSNDLYNIVALPLLEHLPGENMIATEVASPFIVPIKLAFFMALFTGMPYILHQLWTFVAPGLYLREKKFAVPLLASSILLFYVGVVFAYFVIFPTIFQFFATVTPQNVVWMTDINSYLSFIVKLVMAFGIVFEIPVAIFLLTMTGMTTPQTLKKGRPYIFVGCFVIGMMMTPPDIVSQVLLAIPAWILFEIGLFLAKRVYRDPEES